MQATDLPGYELFFAPLAVTLDPTDLERTQFAYIASKYGHARQTREGGGRYFDHPKAAAWIYIHELGGRDARAICDLLLHDLQEDAYLLSSHRMALNFGEDIALDVRALTKVAKGKETTEEYLARVVARGPHTVLAKLCDRLHNLRSLAGCTPEKQARQIAETREYHLRLLPQALVSCGAPWTTYAEYLERAIVEIFSHHE